MSFIKKHILILPRWYPNENDIQLGIFIKKQAELIAQHHQVSVIYVQPLDGLKEKFKILNFNSENLFEQIVYFKQPTGIFKKIIHFIRYKKAQKLAYQNIKEKIDFCHVHVPIRPLFLALFLKKKMNIPFIVTEHWSGHLNGEFQAKSSFYKSLYKKHISKAYKRVCVSKFLQNQLKENTGFEYDIVPNYIESIQQQNQKEKNNKINILTVSDLVDETKNISGIIKAFQKALQKNKYLNLTIIGGGPDENKLKKIVSDLGLNENIHFLGRLTNDEVLKHYQNCAFYISNSNFETFGMTLAEALMAGKPVLSTLSGGPNEFLNEKNSLIHTKNNLEELENNITKMCEMYDSFSKDEIVKSINENYGKEIVLSKLLDLYA